MFCSKCGKQIPDDSTFCPFCGNAVAQAAPSTPEPRRAAPQQTAPEAQVSIGLHILIIVATVLIPLVGLIMGVIYIRSDSPAKKKAGKVWLTVGIIAFFVNMLIFLGESGY